MHGKHGAFKNKRDKNQSFSYCPECGTVLFSFDITKCERCERLSKDVECNYCNIFFVHCDSCGVVLSESTAKKLLEIKRKESVRLKSSDFYLSNWLWFGVPIIIVAAIITCYKFEYSQNLISPNVKVVEKLRQKYPSQKNETWYHILSVLEKETPTVNSIILLHDKSEQTCECLINQLVDIYTESKDLRREEVVFKTREVEDYGQLLEHYHPLVKKHRVLVTNLNKVPASIARIFHTLCDDISSDIKPSLFIFTLQYKGDKKWVKPIQRADTLLKEAWRELPDSEVFPLLSRVVKNVVEIVPENQIKC